MNAKSLNLNQRTFAVGGVAVPGQVDLSALVAYQLASSG